MKDNSGTENFNLKRLINNIKKKGLKWPVQRIFYDIIIDRYILNVIFDLKYGTDTRKSVNLKNLSIKSENKKHGVYYGTTSSRHFHSALRSVIFPNSSVFIDIGSGKGKNMMMAERYHFKKIKGVEFSKDLCITAEKNMISFQSKRHYTNNIFEVIHSDITEYTVDKEDNIFFLNNPFDEIILKKFIQNIMVSVETHPRQVWLIYYNPLHEEVIAQSSILEKNKQLILNGMVCSVFMNKHVHD